MRPGISESEEEEERVLPKTAAVRVAAMEKGPRSPTPLPMGAAIIVLVQNHHGKRS